MASKIFKGIGAIHKIDLEFQGVDNGYQFLLAKERIRKRMDKNDNDSCNQIFLSLHLKFRSVEAMIH